LVAELGRHAVPVEEVGARAFALLADTETPQGIMAVIEPRRSSAADFAPRPGSVVLVIDGVQDPGNVGTLIRTADAFGAAVALSDGCADPTSPKALRASAGSIWRVPVESWGPRNRLLRGTTRVALLAHGGQDLAQVDLSGRVSFLLGAERAGLDGALPRDVEATIPIRGAESLNVAATGAIALYELARRAAA
jgi:RNA methyltransferase, TrmH family